MRPFGHSRKDKQECGYGCCTGKCGKQKNCRALVDRARRKTGRREAKLFTSLLEKDVDI